MRLGCTVSTYKTKFGPIVLKDGDLEYDFTLMNRYGYTGVDMFVNAKDPETLKEYKKIMDAHGIHMATYIAIFLAENGVKLSERDAGKRRRNIDMVKRQLENARFFNAGGMAMGFIRGGYDEEKETEDDALKRIAEALGELGEFAESLGTKILLEPINRYEINTLNSAVSAVDFIDQYQLRGTGILLDAFHMNIEDRSIGESIIYAKNHAVNMHLADSNRRAVGMGHLDVKEVIEALKAIDFKGDLVLEAFSDDPEESLRMTREKLSQLEDKLEFRFEA